MYQPVGSNSDTIVAGAEFTPDSALLFMTLLEEQKEAEKQLQEARETAFFDGKRATEITFEDIQTDDLLLHKNQLQELQSLNGGTWNQIIEDCYRYSEHRENEKPLDRLQSVSHNSDVPSERQSVEFDMDNVDIKTVGGEETVEVNITPTESIKMYVNTDNMEFYKGMYDPPITFDINALGEYADAFNQLTIRNTGKIGRELMQATKPDTINREISKTEVILGNTMDTKQYIPQEVIEEDTDEPTELDRDVEQFRTMQPLPNKQTKKKLFETLEKGYLVSEQSLKLFELFTGKQRGTISYSYLSYPRYTKEVATLLNKEMTNIPQQEQMLFTDESPPQWIQKLEEQFPEKNKLIESEKKELAEYVGYPDFLSQTNNWNNNLTAKEILLELFEKQEIPHDHIVSYYLVPWDSIKPTEKSVRQAIEYGENLRNRLNQIDEEYNTQLYESTVVWEQRKIYRRSEFQTE